MDDKLFAAVDRMIDAGGQKVDKGKVVGDLAKKSADALLADLEKHDYIRKEGKKFTLTDTGRQAWDGKATPARKQELSDRAVAEFLAAVVKQNGKSLTPKQMQLFDERFIKRVQADELIVEAGANKYKLSPKGDEFLKAREPLDHQLQRLRTATQDLLKAPRALLQRLVKDVEQLAEGGPVRAAFAEARAAIQEKVASAQAEFERSLEGLQGFASLIAAGQALKKALPAEVSGALARIDAEAIRVQKLEAELRQTADQLRKEMEQARQQMEQRAGAVEEKARAEKKSAIAGETTPAPRGSTAAELPSDEAIWQAMQRAYERLEQQFKLTSELIKVPNLTDRVQAGMPGLTAAHFHELLQRWQREDRLVLQVCNNPHAEPRSAEGIPSSRGLLFYVEMK